MTPEQIQNVINKGGWFYADIFSDEMSKVFQIKSINFNRMTFHTTKHSAELGCLPYNCVNFNYWREATPEEVEKYTK